MNNIPEYLDVDKDLAGGFRPLPTGTFPVRLIDAQVQVSPGKDPSIVAYFEVTRGDYKGEEVRVYRSMAVYPPKKEGSGWYAPGLVQMKADLRSVGQCPPGTKMPTDANEARKMYAKAFARKEVELYIYEETYIDRMTGENKSSRKFRVTGVYSGSLPVGEPDSLEEYADDSLRFA